jgi:photosystem II stability/assembly factor-like uncharacterized protein
MTRLLFGTRKGRLELERGTSSWSLVQHAHSGIGVSYAMRDKRSGTTWAALDHGHWGAKLARLGHGTDWAEVAAPKYPEGEVVFDPWTKGPNSKPASMELIWVMQEGGDDHPERFYLGTIPGGLFRSDDGGDTFELVRGLWDHPSRPTHWFGGGKDRPGIHSVIVHPDDSERVLIAVSCAGVFETRDGGASWHPRNLGVPAGFLPDDKPDVGQDPHFLALCSAHPGVLWQQNHVGVFRSTDAGMSWSEVSEADGPVGFGFPIAVSPTNPEVAWVVPGVSDEHRIAVDGRLQVCRTEDGGKSWMALRTGLPQALSYDVVYRHALDLRGEELVFGSTTGNLYWSGDGGDTWECVGANLPPIYSVRFA